MTITAEGESCFFPEQPPRQQSYLLRCMETRTAESTQPSPSSDWRFSLQDPRNNAVYNFGDLEGLVVFLQNMLNENLDESASMH